MLATILRCHDHAERAHCDAVQMIREVNAQERQRRIALGVELNLLEKRDHRGIPRSDPLLIVCRQCNRCQAIVELLRPCPSAVFRVQNHGVVTGRPPLLGIREMNGNQVRLHWNAGLAPGSPTATSLAPAFAIASIGWLVKPRKPNSCTAGTSKGSKNSRPVVTACAAEKESSAAAAANQDTNLFIGYVEMRGSGCTHSCGAGLWTPRGMRW